MKFTTPEMLAKQIGCSPRLLRRLAREHGACHIIGKTMFLTDEDVAKLLAATQRPPVNKRDIGSDYYQLARMRLVAARRKEKTRR